MSKPVPTRIEDKNSFILRCMSDIMIIKEYPDIEERLCECNSIFEKHINNYLNRL